MASLFSSLKRTLTRLLIFVPVLIGLCIGPMTANALYPTDTVDSGVGRDLHGQKLQNTEYVKYDLSGADLSEADLTGSYFSVATLRNANLSGATLKNVIAYATRFDNADLSGANLTGADLMKSVFTGASIDGADFTDAMLDRNEQKALCQRASGKTAESLQCDAISNGYVPASEGENKFNPGRG